MNEKNFVKAMKKASATLDHDAVKERVKDLIDRRSATDLGYPRGHKDLIIAMEECGELIQEISKKLRGKDNRLDLLQELVDVQLSLYAIQEVCGISEEDLSRAINVKIGFDTKKEKKRQQLGNK